MMNDFTKEDQLVHKLEKLHQYLSGAHSVCDHDNSRATFHQCAQTLQEIILWIREENTKCNVCCCSTSEKKEETSEEFLIRLQNEMRQIYEIK